MDAEMQSEQSGTTEEPTQGDLQSLGDLLAADGYEEEDTPGGETAESSGSEEKTTPTRFNDLAGAMDDDLDALYQLEVQIEGVDEPVTIEQLKDHFKGASDLELERIEFEESRTNQQNEMARAKAELEEILSALPANAVKPEVLQRIREKAEAAIARERVKTLEAIPAWDNDETRATDLEGMSGHLQAYGFPVNQLEQMPDHRWMRYIRDNYLREQRVKNALAKVRQGKPEKSGKAPAQDKAARKAPEVIKPQAGQSRLEAFLTSA